MNNGAASKPQQRADVHNQPLNSWLQKPAAKPSKPFKVRMLHDLEKEQTELTNTETPPETQAAATGLEAVLGLVRGKKPPTVLDGTRKQWDQFKKDDNVNEELETYKKGKERYTDRMAFLARSDVREWEFEQKGKRKQR
ncbi:Bucentaur [Gracilaria domingensis]|nr:Bucentaur [Gracilaria domingensis]